MIFTYEFYIGAAPEKVWDVLVTPEGTKAVFFNCVLETSLAEGDAFAYVGPGNDGDRTVHVYGTLLTVKPGQELSYLEHPGPSYYENHEQLQSRVTFKLEPVGGTTKLTLINDEWTPAEHPSLANAKAHWWMILSNVKTVAETGKALDFGW